MNRNLIFSDSFSLFNNLLSYAIWESIRYPTYRVNISLHDHVFICQNIHQEQICTCFAGHTLQKFDLPHLDQTNYCARSIHKNQSLSVLGWQQSFCSCKKIFFLFFNLDNTTSFPLYMHHRYLWLVANTDRDRISSS